MAVVIPQVITEDRAAAASVATGSFVFPDSVGQHKLSFQPGSSGNTGTYTVSMWVKNSMPDAAGSNPLWSASPTTDNNNYYGLYFNGDQLRVHDGNPSNTALGSQKLRDPNSWYHIHSKMDSNRLDVYVNGEQYGTYMTLNAGWWNNTSYRMDIGSQAINNGVTGAVYANYQFAQVYHIDGQALGPEYFGSTDSLTGVWSPKSFDINDTPGGSWGTNGFYLPMDGKTHINEDQSPNNHIFYTNYFSTTAGVASGSLSNHVTLDKATGAIPILKTDPSGQVMTGGPRTDRRSFKVTVVSTDEGNKYFLNGERVSPGSLALYRGGLYTFDQSDSSNATHPLRFATAADAAGSTEYTDGVTQGGTPGSTGAYTEIIVPHNAPDTLYYYCTNHGGMGGPIANTTDIHVADPYAWKLQLAVAFSSKNTSSADRGMKNWASGYTNYTVDSGGSASGRTMAVGPDIYLTANNTRNTATEYAFYGGSRNFNNSQTDFITINGTGNGAAFAFGTGDFTLECWANFNSLGEDSSSAILTTAPASMPAGSWIWGFTGANAPTNCFGFCHDVVNFTWEAGKIDGYFHTWHHYAVCRKNGVIKMFIDGVLWRAFSNTYDYSYEGSPQIGQRWTSTNDYSLDGEIQDLRVYKGVAKYFDNTSTTVGEVEFLCGTSKPYFTPEVPKGTPYPGTLKKIEGGAVHFPYRTGTNTDYLEIVDSTDFDLGSGDFTIECFFYVDKQQQNYGTFCGKIDSGFSVAGSSFVFRQELTNRIQFALYSGSTAYAMVSTQHNFQEFSWNHAAVTRVGNKLYMYVNGHLESTNDLGSALSMNNTSNPIQIGGANPWASSGFAGYISNLRIVKGTAVYTSQYPPFAGPTASFAPPTGPLENVPGTVLLCCQSTTSAAEATVSPGAITVNGRAGSTNFSPFINNLLQLQGPENNYAVLEASKIKTHTGEINDGGLSFHGATSSAWNTFPGTMGASSGKWYWEVYDKNGLFDMFVGAAQDGSFHMWDTDVYPGQSSYGNSFGLKESGNLYVNGAQTGSWVNGYAATDPTKVTIGVALDMDEGKAYISINGVWGPDSSAATNGMVSDGTATAAATGLTGTYRPVIGVNGGTYNWDTIDVNFGQRPFRYAPPEGYKCWNRTNLPVPTKAAWNATKNFGVVTWTGDGTNGRDITGLEFQPDMVWIKRRNGANQHNLYDSVRGVTVHLTPDNTYPDQTTANSLTAFNSDGFQVGINASDNTSSSTYVAWCWKAGGAAVTNNDGSITSQVSANTDAGFSIVSYTGNLTAGATVGHGLNSAPEFIIVKNRDDVATNWECKHKDLSNDDMMLKLNNDDAQEDLNGWNNTAPTDTVFTLGAANGTNRSGDAFIAYCFHSVEGYCKAGKYIGNGNASGPVIYTEFKPAFVMTKRIDSNFGGEWSIFDNARNTTNPNNNLLAADLNNAETTADIDFLSNGFKLRMAGNWQNQGGGEYIYLAFAEAPTNAGFGAVTNAR